MNRFQQASGWLLATLGWTLGTLEAATSNEAVSWHVLMGTIVATICFFTFLLLIWRRPNDPNA